MERPTEKLRIASGVLTPLVALGTFGISAALSTTYTWPVEPFSVIGAEGNLTAVLFNAGLVATGLLAVPFATRLWTATSRAVAVLYAMVGVMFIGAGVFPIGGDSIAHELFGAGIFLGIWLLLWTAGILEWRTGARREGMATVELGSITLVVWLPYDFGLTWAQIGLGAAEAVVVVCFGVWSAWVASKHWRRTPSAAGKRADSSTRT